MSHTDKQPYSTPQLIEYGRVEDITRGPGGGSFDSLFGRNGGLLPPHHGGHTSS
jgi:hypothetical protein